ncbi:Condensin-2 complex subunit G2 [Armadillidium nasatum]|uniref:Condensin-2 complex subunit G2 n=1 Tax=Armadillidium nasatum TaxID=96803 RepID=A0A5N5STZ8_9CRUS|nr:Condensin-2 complex subunit G2 [Armadillidium nasatum]
MKTRDELLQLLTENQWKDLPDFIKINSKGPPKTRSNLEEALVELNNSQQDLVWKKILSFFVKNYLGTFFEKNTKERNSEVFPASEEEYLKIFEAILKICILEVKCLVDEKKAVLSVPQHMIQFVVVIGKLIREFNKDVLELSVEICEEWKKDVDRVWHLREGLPSLIELINLNTEDSKYIKDTLVSCSSSSLFLSSENGVKFLSLVFASPCVVSLFHNAIKNRLPYCTKSQSEAYAQIYFRTWKSCQGETRAAIEQNCLQDLMYLAVHADPSAKQLSPNLNAFLHTIHKQKKHLQTASMMYSLYEPFIWRSLKVANGYVRRNAVTLLCDLFPCTDISLSNEEKDELMEKQYQAFLNLLLDPCHFVRIVTVKGITKLLDCPDAGPFITNILPHISSSFDDINASVRISFIKLLLKVKATRFIKYWKLVPMEHLLNRLADDVRTVRGLITKLIYSSFLSAHLDESETLQRCITLIEMNRNGARRFYQHAATSVDLDASVRFILFIWRTLFQYVQLSNAQGNLSTTSLDENGSPNTAGTLSQSRGSKKRKKTTAQREENKENQAEVDNDEMPLHNPVIVGGLLDVIVILWTMKAPNLRSPENFKYLEELRNRISRTFPVMWGFFKENEDISKTLLYTCHHFSRSPMCQQWLDFASLA